MKNQKNKARADGLYSVSVYIGLDENNKRKYKVFYGKTNADAQDKARKFKREFEKSPKYNESYNSFSEWAEKWYNFIRLHGNKNGQNIGYKQLENYRGHLNHLNDYIGTLPLNEVTCDDIQEIIDDFAEENPHTGKPSAKKTLIDLKNTAYNVFDFAIDREVIYRNPVKKVIVPASATTTERRALTPEERKMIEDTPNPRGIVNGVPSDALGMQVPSMIMLYAGLRRGEVIPLKWSDVDLINGTITVNKAVEFHKNVPVIKNQTKTKAGMRIVHIDDKLISYLKTVRSQRVLHLNGLVCPSLDGNMYTPTSWRTGWNCYIHDLDLKYGTDAGKNSKYQKNHSEVTIDRFTPHCLRHTFGSMLYDADVDIKTIQIEMGHSDIKTTMNRYVHVDSDHCAEQMKKMNEYHQKNA